MKGKRGKLLADPQGSLYPLLLDTGVFIGFCDAVQLPPAFCWGERLPHLLDAFTWPRCWPSRIALIVFDRKPEGSPQRAGGQDVHQVLLVLGDPNHDHAAPAAQSSQEGVVDPADQVLSLQRRSTIFVVQNIIEDQQVGPGAEEVPVNAGRLTAWIL